MQARSRRRGSERANRVESSRAGAKAKGRARVARCRRRALPCSPVLFPRRPAPVSLPGPTKLLACVDDDQLRTVTAVPRRRGAELSSLRAGPPRRAPTRSNSIRRTHAHRRRARQCRHAHNEETETSRAEHARTRCRESAPRTRAPTDEGWFHPREGRRRIRLMLPSSP